MKIIKDNKGQVLVFVVVTMAIALAVGVSVSLRTLSSISRTSTSDTSSRVLAAAEGGAERYLSKTLSELDARVGQPDDVITFTGATNDNISTKASVSVTKYPADPLGKFTFIVKQGKVVQINLSGYGSSSIDLCWSSVLSAKDSDLYYSVYSGTAILKKFGLKSISRNGFPSGYSNNFESAGNNSKCGQAASNFKNISWSGTAKYLRIYSINNDSTVELFPSGNLPTQGYKITSVGELNDIVSNQKVTKTVTVLRRLPYLPAMFDFGIYSDSGTVQ